MLLRRCRRLDLEDRGVGCGLARDVISHKCGDGVSTTRRNLCGCLVGGALLDLSADGERLGGREAAESRREGERARVGLGYVDRGAHLRGVEDVDIVDLCEVDDCRRSYNRRGRRGGRVRARSLGVRHCFDLDLGLRLDVDLNLRLECNVEAAVGARRSCSYCAAASRCLCFCRACYGDVQLNVGTDLTIRSPCRSADCHSGGLCCNGLGFDVDGRVLHKLDLERRRCRLVPRQNVATIGAPDLLGLGVPVGNLLHVKDVVVLADFAELSPVARVIERFRALLDDDVLVLLGLQTLHNGIPLRLGRLGVDVCGLGLGVHLRLEASGEHVADLGFALSIGARG